MPRTKSKSYPCSTYSLNEYQLDMLLLAAERWQWKLYRNRIGKEYLIYCTVCHRYEKVSAREMEMINASHICPMCFNSIKTGYFPKKGKEFWSRVMINVSVDEAIWLGYHICYTFDSEKLKPTLKFIRHEATFQKDSSWDYAETWINGIQINMWSICESSKEGWRYVRRKHGYYGYTPDYASFYSEATDITEAYKTKKSYYSDICKHMKLKSNQIKFIRDGLFNKQQIHYIEAFNLNSADEVLKYSKYIKDHDINYNMLPTLSGEDRIEIRNTVYNVYFLDYLSRNNIHIRDYIDYVRMLQELGRKPDKPKDFWKAHNDVMILKNVKKNEELHEKVAGRYEEVQKKYGYKKGSIEIKAMKDIEEVELVASRLHNCIAKAYAKPYAAGKTDVIFGTDDGEITFAIEVVDDKVVQLRMDYNKSATEDVQKVVKKWAKEKQIVFA